MSVTAGTATPPLQFKPECDDNNFAFFDNADDIQMLMHDAHDATEDDNDCVCPTAHDTIAAL